jgi:ornithine cyclodeaminase
MLGILGTGIQARLLAQLHATVLPLDRIVIWGRTPERAEACRRDLAHLLPGIHISAANSPTAVAEQVRLIATATASCAPLLSAPDLQPGTHISAVGADSPGKQELDSEILRRATLLLADSRRQCEKLGELQHAPDQWTRAVEIGEVCQRPSAPDPAAITVCDFTGLGVEDLYIAEYCYERAL